MHIYLLKSLFLLVNTNVDYITKLSLKKQISTRKIINNLSIDINGPLFRSELMQSYNDMGFTAALINKSTYFYDAATYFCDDTGSFVKQQLHIKDIVTIQEEDYGENYAIIEAIFSHYANNSKLYAFVIVNWFEETSQAVLGCPEYKLIMDDSWRRVFPISIIDSINKVHFVHKCVENTCKKSHDMTNNHYIKNMYYFTAI
jgi:hypothetical protein